LADSLTPALPKREVCANPRQCVCSIWNTVWLSTKGPDARRIQEWPINPTLTIRTTGGAAQMRSALSRVRWAFYRPRTNSFGLPRNTTSLQGEPTNEPKAGGHRSRLRYHGCPFMGHPRAHPTSPKPPQAGPPRTRIACHFPRRLHRGDYDCARLYLPHMLELIRTGLASAHTERVVAGGQRREVASPDRNAVHTGAGPHVDLARQSANI
jgi:hypothetical protein